MIHLILIGIVLFIVIVYAIQCIVITANFLSGDFSGETVKDFLLQYIPLYWFFKKWKEHWEDLDHGE